ncbi:hypothetical protein LOCC1_G003404 [Lachnellula occidentalis]|uniref:MARVEL domain-containing protein n=1 Tax=Lachnellula occidentalis TaxID=215460 RepID=A0A8H8S2X3_9HELO|nr:hypothetical protein LOCC1_G003404 [Lachnellula occidentalis]
MIVTLAVRALQLVFAIIVLALSIVLIKDFGPVYEGYKEGNVPSLIDYGAFCGGASIIIAIVGVVAAFFEALQGITILALDALASFFLLAGGLAFAIKLKVGNCSDIVYLGDHSTLFSPDTNKNFGVNPNKDLKKYEKAALADLTYRCQLLQADTAFVWFLFACFLGTTALSFTMRSKGSKGTMV